MFFLSFSLVMAQIKRMIKQNTYVVSNSKKLANLLFETIFIFKPVCVFI
ncbi:hypothetical protein HMPREF0083_03727 [Aneurinibacillus aneurinilyticus ATCC 12856]|uniref:Uncharacterized protein n=1 Tax=Aneurinibacillus aneurinilyticus ATCC 12856 TaxID=649747 RepID=U1WHY8_ANEAE|nr:hypothetical protein HMPREF0083_03727 [Aneurinibacillus aneurinilyticus ATCC 12856]